MPPRPPLVTPGPMGATALLLLLSGCLHSHRGLLRADAEGLALIEIEGRRLVVQEEGEGALLRALVGCEVEIEARGGARRLRVASWEVLRGPDGAQPFVGVLALGQGSWTLADRSTGQTLSLDLDGDAGLVQHAGQLVMITGYVVGTQRIRVVDWRALVPATP